VILMLTISELKPEQLKKQYDNEVLGFETTAEVPPLEGILGQERASRAMDFGLKVERQGYNIYVAGLNGTGRSSYARSIVQSVAKDKPVPLDWCYVYNFEDSYQPLALSMPAGVGSRLKEDMNRLIDHLKKEIPKAFSGEDYNKRRARVVQDFQEKTSKLMEELNRTAKEHGFEFKRSATGLVSIPLIDGRPISEEEYRNLGEDKLKEIEARNDKLQMRAVEIFNGIKELELKAQDAIRDLDAEIAMDSVGYVIGELKAKYQECDCPEILEFLDSVQKDIVKNAGALTASPASTSKLPPTPMAILTLNLSRLECIHFSCFGLPRATKSTSAPEEFICSTMPGTSPSLKYPCHVPFTLSPGNRRDILSAAFSAIPGLPPRRYMDLPSLPSISSIPTIKSNPATLSGSGWPYILDAHTTPMPSGTTRSPDLKISMNSLSLTAFTTISELGV
jgi:hypothetical protein